MSGMGYRLKLTCSAPTVAVSIASELDVRGFELFRLCVSSAATIP